MQADWHGIGRWEELRRAFLGEIAAGIQLATASRAYTKRRFKQDLP